MWRTLRVSTSRSNNWQRRLICTTGSRSSFRRKWRALPSYILRTNHPKCSQVSIRGVYFRPVVPRRLTGIKTTTPRLHGPTTGGSHDARRKYHGSAGVRTPKSGRDSGAAGSRTKPASGRAAEKPEEDGITSSAGCAWRSANFRRVSDGGIPGGRRRLVVRLSVPRRAEVARRSSRIQRGIHRAQGRSGREDGIYGRTVGRFRAQTGKDQSAGNGTESRA